QEPMWRRLTFGILASAALSACLFSANTTLLAQASRANEHWVGTWATALVARAQMAPQAQGRGQAEGQAPQAQGARGGQAAPQGQAPQATTAPAEGGGRGRGRGQAPEGQAPQAAQGQAPQGQAPQAANAPAQGGGRGPAAPPLNFNNQTLRQIVHTSLGGTRARVVLSNLFGTAPLQ